MMRSKGILILAVLLISMSGYGNEVETKSREVITAQWETLKKLSDAIPRKAGGGVTSLLNEDAVTTNLADAYKEAPFIDAMKLGEPRPVETLPTDENGYRMLYPGYYSEKVATY